MTRLRTPFAILAAALLLTWPALLNYYRCFILTLSVTSATAAPPSSLCSITPTSALVRSELYSLGIFPSTGIVTPWPIIGP